MDNVNLFFLDDEKIAKYMIDGNILYLKILRGDVTPALEQKIIELISKQEKKTFTHTAYLNM